MTKTYTKRSNLYTLLSYGDRKTQAEIDKDSRSEISRETLKLFDKHK